MSFDFILNLAIDVKITNGWNVGRTTINAWRSNIMYKDYFLYGCVCVCVCVCAWFSVWLTLIVSVCVCVLVCLCLYVCVCALLLREGDMIESFRCWLSHSTSPVVIKSGCITCWLVYPTFLIFDLIFELIAIANTPFFKHKIIVSINILLHLEL